MSFCSIEFRINSLGANKASFVENPLWKPGYVGVTIEFTANTSSSVMFDFF